MDNTDKTLKVTNRSGSEVVYNIPDMRVRRSFVPRETKLIQYSELQQLMSQPGGRELIYGYLLIEDAQIVKDLTNKEPEIEYYFTEQTIDAWLNSCSLDQFKDALDFAPEGTIELIKDHSVSLPLTDTRKQEALKEKFGFNCARAIQNERDTVEDGEDVKKEAPKRRVAVKTEESVEPSRRVSVKTPKED